MICDASISQAKKVLRRTIRTKMRQEWTADYRQSVSQCIAERIITFEPFVHSQCIALYCAMADEVDLSTILEAYKKEKCLVVPRVEGDNINFYSYHPEALARSHDYKILEPTARESEAIDPTTIDLILVPGLAFDPLGGRLGRGKGYYDRFFVRAPQALRIAITSSIQIVEHIPLDPWDATMHYIISEDQTWSVQRGEYPPREFA